MSEQTPLGLYLHVPFCRSKCPYCDFYSFHGSKTQMDRYCKGLSQKILESASAYNRKADTLYIGGGTPSVLGAERLCALINQAKQSFLLPNSEITVECNPYKLPPDLFNKLKEVGVNRVSIGLQSAVDEERRALGRLSDKVGVETAVRAAQKAGIPKISLDVMLGVPKQTENSLAETLSFCLSLGVGHISAYILKLEENTYFYTHRDTLQLPDDDQTADLYLQMCETLENAGILQYEISNFAKPGEESRHNLKYWHCEEYLGLGPAAHSFINGERFYYPRNAEAFLSGGAPVKEGKGGDFSEYAMLALRLTEGLQEEKVRARFGHDIPKNLRYKAEALEAHGLLQCDENGIRLTRNGFLLSNAVLAELL